MSDQPAFTRRVFSGVQPTGNLTLGNYLGAVRNFVKLQDDDSFDHRLYCVVDLHAITVQQDPAELRSAIREVAAAFIACGLDPARSTLFNQSRVTTHAELGWIFNCISRMGWLNRMTQFKEKAGKNRENASVGLYVYPNLMAADILAYKATHVPVGEDQKQHLELCRDIAAKFNHDFGVEALPLTEPLIAPETARIMSLRDGTKKMSKSDPSDLSRINLNDTADQIAQKIRKAKSDPEPLPSEADGLEDRPEARNLVGIFSALSGDDVASVLSQYGGQGFGAFKPALAELTVEKIAPIGDEMRRLAAQADEIDAVLAKGAERALALSRPVLDEMYEIMGLVGGASSATA